MADASVEPNSGNLSVSSEPNVRDVREKAQLCVTAEEYEQAISYFTQALALVSPAASSCAVSLSLIPIDDLSVSPASLSAALLLERAECYVRVLDFDRALVDANRARDFDADNSSVARLQCEALFGLKEERQALKIWTTALLKSPLSSDLKLLKRKFPIAAVHVLHAVAMAKAEAANREVAGDDEGREGDNFQAPRAEEVFVPETVGPPVDDKVPSQPELAGSTTPPPEPERAAEDNYERLLDLDSVDDHTTNWLAEDRNDGTASEPGTPQSSSILGARFEATQISQSMALSSPFVSVNGPDYSTSPLSTSSPLDASFVNMSLSPTQFLDRDAIDCNAASIALPDINLAIRAQSPTAETFAKLYDHALAVEASSLSTLAQKITAFLRYVAFTPLDDKWIPHALYSTSALYLESHKYNEAAQMRFLAEECEKLHERLGTSEISQTSPKKREVDNAFTPPWLVLSFDLQRVCVMNGSLHCHLCGSMKTVPLVQYVEHRTKLCPGRMAFIDLGSRLL